MKIKTKFNINVIAGAIAGTLLFVAVPALADPQYSITDLGSLKQFGSSDAAGINATGQVTGYTSAGTGYMAYLYSNGVMQGLGTIPGGKLSRGNGINASGQVTGWSYTGDFGLGGSYVTHAFAYSAGTLNDLGTLGGQNSSGNAINASGQVAGTSDYVQYGYGSHAFVYSNGSMHDLGTLGGSASYGNGINDVGQVTGSATTISGAEHAFLFANGSMQDLGTLGGSKSVGSAINANGLITGWSYTVGDSAQHAFIYDGSQMLDLGALNGGASSTGKAINSLGQVVGAYNAQLYGSFLDGHAFLYSNGASFDLTGLLDGSGVGWNLLDAAGINDIGQIVGTGIINGQQHAYLLTPAVPVPGAAILMLSGFGVLGAAARRRKVN